MSKKEQLKRAFETFEFLRKVMTSNQYVMNMALIEQRRVGREKTIERLQKVFENVTRFYNAYKKAIDALDTPGKEKPSRGKKKS